VGPYESVSSEPDRAPGAAFADRIRAFRANIEATDKAAAHKIAALDGGCAVVKVEPGQAARALCPAQAVQSGYEGPVITWKETKVGWQIANEYELIGPDEAARAPTP
jgi:hypothetical protein